MVRNVSIRRSWLEPGLVDIVTHNLDTEGELDEIEEFDESIEVYNEDESIYTGPTKHRIGLKHRKGLTKHRKRTTKDFKLIY